MLPQPKYKIGQTVYRSWYETKIEKIECPDCLDTKTWKVITPAGDELEAECQTCTGWNNTRRNFVKCEPYILKLTIGSIQINTADYDNEFIRYMCNETGIGSGSVYKESDLFVAKHEAEKKAERLAKDKTKELNDNNKRTEQDRKINNLTLVNACFEDAKRQIREGLQELKNWNYFLDDLHLEPIKTKYEIDMDTITDIVEYIREKFRSTYNN